MSNKVSDEIWADSYFIDRIFTNMMENGRDKQTGLNRYIQQLADKYMSLVLRSPVVSFDIYIEDLDEETLGKLNELVQDCKTPDEKHLRLSYIFTEVIQLVMMQAKPLILSKVKGPVTDLDMMLMNRIREIVSGKWVFEEG